MLTEFEFEIAKELINISLANSADAFSKMAMEKVEIRDFSVERINTYGVDVNIGKLKESVVVLTTEVKGNLKGKSYLIFDEKDIINVIKIYTKHQLKNIDEKLTEYQKAILLELDNIVSAAMVTQLSNILEVLTYGDVPQLHFFVNGESKSFFEKDIQKYSVVLKVYAKFQTIDSLISPSFVWLFKDDFIVAIQDLVKRKKHLALVKPK